MSYSYINMETGTEDNTDALLNFLESITANIKTELDKTSTPKRKVNHRKYLQKRLYPSATKSKSGYVTTRDLYHSSIQEKSDRIGKKEEIRIGNKEEIRFVDYRSDGPCQPQTYPTTSNTSLNEDERKSKNMRPAQLSLQVKELPGSIFKEPQVVPKTNHCNPVQYGLDVLADYLSPDSPLEDLLSSPTWKKIVASNGSGEFNFSKLHSKAGDFPGRKVSPQSECNSSDTFETRPTSSHSLECQISQQTNPWEHFIPFEEYNDW